MNKLLKRLLRKHLPSSISQEDIQPLTQAFADILEQNDQDRLMLERSLMLTSDELNEINLKLKRQLNEVKSVKGELEISLVKQRALFDASPEAVVSFRMNGTI